MRLEFLVRDIDFLELTHMCSLCIELPTVDFLDCGTTISNLVNASQFLT